MTVSKFRIFNFWNICPCLKMYIYTYLTCQNIGFKGEGIEWNGEFIDLIVFNTVWEFT